METNTNTTRHRLTEAEINNYWDWHEGQNEGARTFHRLSEAEINDHWAWVEGQNEEVK